MSTRATFTILCESQEGVVLWRLLLQKVLIFTTHWLKRLLQRLHPAQHLRLSQRHLPLVKKQECKREAAHLSSTDSGQITLAEKNLKLLTPIQELGQLLKIARVAHIIGTGPPVRPVGPIPESHLSRSMHVNANQMPKCEHSMMLHVLVLGFFSTD